MTWSEHIGVSPGCFSMPETLAQSEVVLKGIRILEGNGYLLEKFSLLFCDEFDEINFFLGSSRWPRFLLIKDARFSRSVHFETAEVDIEGIIKIVTLNGGRLFRNEHI